MEECDICKVEKKEEEFKDMRKYGCTCKTSRFCNKCILGWLEAKSEQGPTSLEQWECPGCRRGYAPARMTISVMLSSELQKTLVMIHRQWEEVGREQSIPFSFAHQCQLFLEEGKQEQVGSYSFQTYRFVYRAGDMLFGCMLIDAAPASMYIMHTDLPAAEEEKEEYPRQLFRYISHIYARVKNLLTECVEQLTEATGLVDVLQYVDLFYIVFLNIIPVIQAMPGHKEDTVSAILVKYAQYQKYHFYEDQGFVSFYCNNPFRD